MQSKLAAALMVALMAASSFSFIAGGATIEFSNVEEGMIISSKVLNVNGTASPTQDEWVQSTKAQFLEGSLDNLTLNMDDHLEVLPYIASFKKDANNPQVSFGGNHTFNEFGMLLGALIKDGDTYRSWAMGMNRSFGWSLGYGTSTDGNSFTFQNGTFGLGGPGAFDSVTILPGTVITDGGTYKMWYTGEDDNGIYSIGYATSADGITWTKGAGGNAVVDLGPINKFDGGGTAFPAVIKDGNTYKMWYAGLIAYSGDLWQIGYATSNNGVNWTKKNNNDPVVSFGKTQAFDKDGVIMPTVIKDGNVYRMWYTGIPTPAIGYSTSPNGIEWTRQYEGAPVLGLGAGGSFDESAIYTPKVFRDGNKYKMYYSGIDGFGDGQVGLATANLEGLTGIFVSNFYDAGIKVDWLDVGYEADAPSGTTVTVETRASVDRVDWSSWAEPVGGMSAQENGRYFQLRATMTSPDGLALPSLSSLSAVFQAIERVEISTDNATWYMATGTYEWNATMKLKEGMNNIYVRVIDTTGVPTYKTMSLRVDTLLPTGIIQINNDKMYTTDPSVQLTMAAVDASGVTKMRLATTQDALYNTSWEDFSTSASIDLIDVDGTQTVYCQMQDGTGLASKVISDSIILDTTAPNGTVAIKAGAPMTTFLGVILSLQATDANGIDQMRIGHDANFTGSEWKSYAAAADWTLQVGDGIKTVFVEFKDRAGNSAMFSDDIILDTTAPTGSIAVNGGDEIAMTRYVDLTLTGQDTNGVSHVMLSNEPDFLDGLWMTFNGTMDWLLRERIGPQKVYAKFKDSAGLVSQVYSDEIILDIHEEGFEGSILINDGEDVTGNLTFTVTLGLIGDDGHSSVMLSENSGFTGANWKPYNETMTFTTTTTNGEVTVYAKFKDRYGILSEVVSDKIIVDTTAPVVSIKTPEDGSKVTDQILTVTGTASDNVGLKTVEVQLPNGQWIPVNYPENYTAEINLIEKGDHTITVRATDTAGNVNTASVMIKYKEKKVDDTTPGFEATALVLCTLLVVLLLSRRRVPRV